MLDYVLIVAMLLTGLVPMALEGLQGRFDFFNLKNAFIVYYLLQLAASGFVTLQLGPSDIGLEPSTHQSAYEAAFALSLLGLLAFQFGYYWRSNRPLPIPDVLSRPWRRARCSWLSVGYLAFGLAAFVILVQVNGGLATFLADREKLRAGGLVGQGILTFPATALMSIAVLIYFLSRIPRRLPVTSWLKVLGALLLALVPALFLGFRSALALPVLQFMVVWNYGYRRIKVAGMAVASLVIIVGFTIYGITREVPEGVNIDPQALIDVAVNNPELVYAVVSRSKGTEVVAAEVDKLGSKGEFEWGWRSALELLTIMVPKAIWSDKPTPVSERFADYFFGADLSFTRGYEADSWGGISPTAVGEWYWNFGAAGVAVGLFILGRVARAAYATLQAYRHNRSVVLVYAVFFTSFAMFAESQQNYANGLVLYAIALYFSFLVITIRVKWTSAPVSMGKPGPMLPAADLPSITK